MTFRAPDRRSLRLPDFGYSTPGQVYFVTIRAHKGPKKRPPFQEPALARKIVDSLNYLRDRKSASLLGYCLMPDHLHVLLSPSDRSGRLIDVVRDFKSYTTRVAWSLGWSGRLWARSFHERAVRSESELVEVCGYILANPVKAGLVEEAEEYPYSGIADSLLG